MLKHEQKCNCARCTGAKRQDYHDAAADSCSEMALLRRLATSAALSHVLPTETRRSPPIEPCQAAPDGCC